MNPLLAIFCMLFTSTISTQEEIPTVPIDENVENAIYTQWYTEALGGLSAAVSQDLLKSVPSDDQVVHTECFSKASGLIEYSSCFGQLWAKTGPDFGNGIREKRQVRLTEPDLRSGEVTDTSSEAVGGLSSGEEAAESSGENGNGTISEANGNAAVELLYFARRLIRKISGKNPMDKVEQAHRHPEQASQLLAVGDPYDGERGERRRPLSTRFGMSAMDGLNEAISRSETPEQHLKSEVQTWFSYFMRDLSTFSINGTQLNANSTGRRVLSPMVLGWGRNQSGVDEVLSPHVLSLVDEPGAIAPLPKLHGYFKNTTKRYWLEKILKLSDTLNLTSDLTGGIDRLLEDDYNASKAEVEIKKAIGEGKVAKFAKHMKDRAQKDLPNRPQPLTKEDYINFNGPEANETIEQFESLYRSLSGDQVKELGGRGFAFMTPEQMLTFYGRLGNKNTSMPFDVEAHANLTRAEQMELLNRSMAAIAEADKFEGRRLKAVVGTPLVLTPLIGASAVVSQPVILSPLVLSPLILSPNVLGPLILSPLVFSPQILSPRVLGPLILSPGVGNPFILSPTVLSPLILSPQVMTPLILSPFVLSPVILSPGVMNPFILSPFVLSPIILSPQALFAVVLSPLVASPIV